jgi:branched-chain amino acid transport system permease protein
VTTLGALTAIGGLMIALVGTEPERVDLLPDETYSLLGGQVQSSDIVLIVVAVVGAIALDRWSVRSRLGLAGLARTEDEEAAELRGVPTRGLSMLGFVLAGLFGGLVGPLIAQKTYAVASLGLLLALKGFAALAVGGLGRSVGILLGGLLVGLIEAFSARYIGSQWGDISVVAVLFAVLFIRPAGLFGRTVARVV